MNCHAEDGGVYGQGYVGGLVGSSSTMVVGQNTDNLLITDCYATCLVKGGFYLGGLVGHIAFGSTVMRCYATGEVKGGNGCGGLVGWSWNGIIADCYATGSVNGSTEIGGLVVDEDCHRRGVGRILMEQAEQWACEKGCGAVYLRSNVIRKETHAFYERIGYTNIKRSKTFRKAL